MLPRHAYVHVPFCARRCAYCDFSIAVRRVVPVREYVDSLRAELALRFGAASGERWELDTLYFGGGTPSRLGAEGVAELVGAVRARATLADDAEVTLEANPEDVDAASVERWRRAGVNRLSLGVQSFDDRVLAWMHRTHDAAAAERAVRAARAGGIDNISIDLIYAIPASVPRDWERDLRRALDLEPAHLSVYGLTVEPATPLGRWTSRGAVLESPEEQHEQEFLLANSLLGSAGFRHYEVSNYAGGGGPSRHNSAYWRGAAYAGLGPAAHEFDGTGRRRWNVGPYAEWVRRLAAGSDPVEGSEELTEANRTAEGVYLALRCDAGVELTAAEAERVRPWVRAGWATIDPRDGRMRLTPSGWLRLDALAADLTLFRSR
ncbi:MAG TPA: radical SAM family heme chaperone HemW [Gemmatimonadaceae bacterium]|nr:radical SAM family heme chaperone HemW [Gemmatimonadaceae bacterium]